MKIPWPIANVALAACILADAMRMFALVAWTRSGVLGLAAALVLAVAALFVLARQPPIRQDRSVASVAIAVAAVGWPSVLAALSLDAQEPAGEIVAVQAVALAFMLWSTVRLGRNFSLVPQYRSLTMRGPYAIVRHPLYLAYLVFDLAAVCGSGRGVALALWIAEAAFLTWRAGREERLLLGCSPAYARYAACVRYRLVPFIY